MAAAQQICHSSNFESVMQEAAGCIGAINGNSMDADINAIIQQVLRESYMDTNQDLKYYAAKVKSFNEQKKCTRSYLQEMRAFKTDLMANVPDAKDNPDKVYNYIMEHMKPAPGATSSTHTEIDYQVVREINTSTVAEIAKNVSIEQKLENADKLISDTFGINMPTEIKSMLEAALKSGNDTQLKAAYREIASFVTYLADSAVANGKFGGAKSGIDDIYHGNFKTPCYEDYKTNYFSDRNNAARSNLSCTGGDQEQLIKAFGFSDEVANKLRTGKDGKKYDTSFEDVVAFAMSETEDAWRNEIQVGIKQRTVDIENDINTKDADSEWVKMYPDVINEYTVANEVEVTEFTSSDLARTEKTERRLPHDGQ